MIGLMKAEDQDKMYVAMWSQPKVEGGIGSNTVSVVLLSYKF